MLFHDSLRTAAVRAEAITANAGKAIPNLELMDWGSLWGRDGHRPDLIVNADVVTISSTVLNEILAGLFREGYTVSFVSVTGRLMGKLGTVPMSANQNPKFLVKEEPKGVQHAGGQQVVHGATQGHCIFWWRSDSSFNWGTNDNSLGADAKA